MEATMPSLIASLRDLVPIRPLTLTEALRVADLQATKFRELSGVVEPPVPTEILTNLPRLEVARLKLTPMSAATQWSHGRWLILLNGAEPPTRQRFSLAHEFKHILDNPFVRVLYPAPHDAYDRRRAEQLCDHFAACLLMPRAWVTALWRTGIHDPRALARRCQVSPPATG